MIKNGILFFFLVVTSCIVNSCKKEDAIDNETQGSGSNVTATLTGIVLDENRIPLKGVSISVYSQLTTTDQNGLFVFKNISVNKDRCIIQCAKIGYFNRTQAVIVSESTVNYFRIILLNNTPTYTVSSSGGTVNLPDGSSIQFQPNSFLTTSGSIYYGQVNLSIKHLQPDMQDFGFMIPGGDLKGKDIQNNQVGLYSYGMLGVELAGSSGNPLQLAPGASATLNMEIAASQIASAPSTIPLWYFEESSSLWIEEGTATRSGNVYTGTVSHFTWWNCDHPSQQAKVLGRVIDCIGNPIPNIVVTLNGWATVLTDQNGKYRSWVPSGNPFTVQVLSSNNNNTVLNSQVENIPALSPNSIWIVADLVVDCPSAIAGRIVNCSSQYVEGMVQVSWNTGSVFQYVSLENAGSFQLPCPPASQVEVLAYRHQGSAVLSFASQYQTLSAGNISNIGDIALCDTLSSVHLNNLILNGGPFSNYHVSFTNLTWAWGNYDTSITGTEVYIVGSTSDYSFFLYDIELSDTLTGSYPFTLPTLNHVNLYFHNGIDTFSVSNSGSYCGPGTFNLLEFNTIGGRVTGNFSGIATLERPNHFGQYPVTVSGNFDVPRDH